MDNLEPRRNIEAALLEESLEDLYDNAPCGYVSTLPDGTFVKVNRTLLAWTGYSRDELLNGKRFQDLLTVGGKIFYETHCVPLLHMQGFVSEIALELVDVNGRRLPVLINSVQKRNANGVWLLNRTTIFNISDRRQYERELLAARKAAEQAALAKAHFLSMMSHEIRTPISAISLSAQLLERSSSDPKQQKYIRTLKAAAQNLLALVNDILDYSRIESGKVVLDQKRFNIHEFISALRDSLADKAEEKNLLLQVDIDDQVPVNVIGDRIKIGQVLTNLMSNAIKFTAQGTVSLTLATKELRDDSVSIEFRVIDTGIGIAPDRLPYIFEEFTQASAEISVQYGGTGLGLAISRQILQLHDSDLLVESVQGEGSTFFFTLNLKRL